MSIPASLRQQVIAEAQYRCEYCKTSSRLTGTPLVMEHILPRSLGGNDARSNLAASCYRCNEFKGIKTHAKDPETGQLVSLFNPRQQDWNSEFTWGNGGTHILGRTPTGRATVLALRLNNEQMVEARAIWIDFGWHPPADSTPT
ncbi:MAG: HNH endonuclease [Leptolyngbya sp. SIO4C1]|nr:HNH endonuclease [Leptolyngbya sp. SIO4C1]